MEGNKRTRRRRHSGLERLKSLLILLLTLSAVALTYRVLMYSDFAGTAPKGWLGGLLSLFSAEQTPYRRTIPWGRPAPPPSRFASPSVTAATAMPSSMTPPRWSGSSTR